MSHPARLARPGFRRVACQALAVGVIIGGVTPTAARAQAPSATTPQRGQAYRANWTLAERFSPANLRSVVYSNGVQARWLGQSDTMWYNWRDRTGSHFYLVVPATGTKRPLFDRARLASELAELAHRPIDPNNLPFNNLTFLKDHKSFRFTVDTVRYEWSTVTQTLKALGRPPRIPPADEERERGGIGGGRGGGGGQGAPGGGGDFRNYSPDSTAFVFARNHNLYLVEVNKADTLRSDTTQVTRDGELDYSFGFRDTTENARQIAALRTGGQQQDEQQGDQQQNEDEDARARDMRVRANVNWSPDSKAFAVSRMDSRKVKDLYLVNALAEPRPALIRYKYAMPGEEFVPQQEVWVVRRADKQAKKLDLKKWRDQRMMDLHWTTGSDVLRMVRRDRPQRKLDLIEVNLATNAIKTILSEQIENASIDPQPVRYLSKGGDLLWWSERSGWAHYYVYDHNGGEKPKYRLSTGAWHTENIAGIDSTRGVVWITANGREDGENPYYMHLYRVNANGTGLTLLNPGNYTHQATLSPSRRYFIDNASRIDAPTKSALRDATTGRVVMDLEDMDVSRLKELGWKPPETFVVKAADGVTDIYGNIWKPFDFDSTRTYPIIASVYPGPQTESITFPFAPTAVQQQLAQLGFVVIQIGNRGGSPQRSLAYHRYGYYNLRDYALADKKSGMEQLAARHKWIDLEKVGIYGHSGGGFLTAAALLHPQYNDFFKVGWSSAGNHDNNIYNQNWSEWNHGLREIPVRQDTARGGRGRRGIAGGISGGADPVLAEDSAAAMGAGTDASVAALAAADTTTDSTRFQIRVPTNTELAGNLKGKLALIHGDLDNNVHPGGTVRLADALIKANKRFDFYIVPGQPHGYRTMQAYANRAMMEYFAEHLLGDYYRSDAIIK